MVFNSLIFLIFFLGVLALHRLPLSWRAKKFNLLIASYLFYAAWNPPFVVLIWISTLVDWFAAKGIGRSRTNSGRRFFLVLSLGTNLGLLGYFKYGEFVLQNFLTVLQAIGISYQPPQWDIVLPVGISFYTFQTLSYTIDVYRGTSRPWSSFLDFALFVTFFPQLVAGPIVRARDFLPQCTTPRTANMSQFGWGCSLLTLGLFQKVVLADEILAPVADQVFGAAGSAGFVDAWIGTLAFSAQIFFDFAGYSTCAIGVAMALGFVLPDNFRYPYGAIGFSDFWSRWHISLSSWLRDYLYIPLGGNRKGPTRTYVNLALTMLLGGLWHGASWLFVVWGALHAIYLIVERKLSPAFSWLGGVARGGAPLLGVVFTYFLVCLTWVFFRAGDFSSAWTLLRAMFGGGQNELALGFANVLNVSVITLALLSVHTFMRHRSLEDVARETPWWVRSLILTALVFAISISKGDSRAFIYFQF